SRQHVPQASVIDDSWGHEQDDGRLPLPNGGSVWELLERALTRPHQRRQPPGDRQGDHCRGASGLSWVVAGKAISWGEIRVLSEVLRLPSTWWRRLHPVLLQKTRRPGPSFTGPPNRVRHGATVEQNPQSFRSFRQPWRLVPDPGREIRPARVPGEASRRCVGGPKGACPNTLHTSGGGP